MTEQQWTTATDLDPLLKWLQSSKRHRPTIRKLQLLANAFTDRIADLFTDPLAVEIRQYMDQLGETAAVSNAIWREWEALRDRLDASDHEYGHILCWAVYPSAPEGKNFYAKPETCVRSVAGYVRRVLGETERVNQTHLLRDIFGNPYRPVAFAAEWQTSTRCRFLRTPFRTPGVKKKPFSATVAANSPTVEAAG
ncbi:MAG: hypothetical protein K8U57_00510 [Planctomycetes bacterium]|nr:hypothetical protein [Planctomycetota bacterium]